MIVFVPIENISGQPSCAFLDTVTDRFVENSLGCHTFDAPDEIAEHPMAERLTRLVPPGFWEPQESGLS